MQGGNERCQTKLDLNRHADICLGKPKTGEQKQEKAAETALLLAIKEEPALGKITGFVCLLLLLVSQCILASAQDAVSSFRCRHSELILPDASKHEVVSKCGEPLSREQVVLGYGSSGPHGTSGYLRTDLPLYGEDWTYCTPGDFEYTLRFAEGRLFSIIRGNRCK